MRHHRILMAAAITVWAVAANAQNLSSAYFTKDYKYRHDMNPAMGNDQSYIAIPVLGFVNVQTQANFGIKDVLFKNPATGKYDRTFMHPEVGVNEALGNLNNDKNKLTGDIGIAIVSVGFKGFGGYNNIELNSKAQFGLSLPYELFRFAKNLNNGVYNIGDIDVRAQAYAELAFGHSRQITDKLRVGAKMKLLFGGARSEVSMKGVKAEMPAGADKWIISGQAKADMMIKGFKFKSGHKDYELRNGGYNYVNDADVDGSGLNGFGLALDLGATYKLMDDLTVSAALTDLGFISWSNDIQAVNTSSSFEFDGFQDISVKSNRDPNTFKHNTKNYSDQIADFVHVTDRGDQGGVTKSLAATLRLGAEYQLPMYKAMAFGLLFQQRFNGPFSLTEGRLSANWEPLKWLDGGVSVALNNYATSTGWILNIHPKAVNFFIGMDHILGKQSKEGIPLSSNASVNFGMNVAF